MKTMSSQAAPFCSAQLPEISPEQDKLCYSKKKKKKTWLKWHLLVVLQNSKTVAFSSPSASLG